jgi:hypothetical protein
MSERAERRRKNRIRINDFMRITWVDRNDKYFATKAACLDASETGLRIEVPERMDPRSYVNIRADRYGLAAAASVRHVVQAGLKYRIGLEFHPGQAWKNLPN